MIYLDSSAAVKLLWREEHSEALQQWLDSRSAPLVSSALLLTEVTRTARRLRPAALVILDQLLDSMLLFPVDLDVLIAAADLPQPGLRSLDAIHLATARALHAEAGLTALVTYDKRMVEAAVGLPALMP